MFHFGLIMAELQPKRVA